MTFIDDVNAVGAALLYDRCVAMGKRMVDGTAPELVETLQKEGVDFSALERGKDFAAEHADAVEFGIYMGVTGAMIQLREEGYLDD